MAAFPWGGVGACGVWNCPLEAGGEETLPCTICVEDALPRGALLPCPGCRYAACALCLLNSVRRADRPLLCFVCRRPFGLYALRFLRLLQDGHRDALQPFLIPLPGPWPRPRIGLGLQPNRANVSLVRVRTTATNTTNRRVGRRNSPGPSLTTVAEGERAQNQRASTYQSPELRVLEQPSSDTTTASGPSPLPTLSSSSFGPFVIMRPVARPESRPAELVLLASRAVSPTPAASPPQMPAPVTSSPQAPAPFAAEAPGAVPNTAAVSVPEVRRVESQYEAPELWPQPP